MLRTILILPDGREISSGAAQQNVIRSFKLTQKVNDTKELTLGSVCANVLEAELQTPIGGLELTAGQEITAYRTDESGSRNLLGQFVLKKPERPSANVLRITAYDRVSLLDRDLSEWLQTLQAWPYTMLDFAQMVCNACGLELVNDTIPNGDFPVQAFYTPKITGRQLMQWIGEATGRFCRATPDGKLEFAWYTPSGVTLTADGVRFFYQDGLSFADYQVTPIQKIQIKQTRDDVGVVWPDETGEKNTYVISGNYLLATDSSDALLPVAQTLYHQMKEMGYTPCKVKIPACMDILPGHSLQIIDKNGKTLTTLVMTKTQAGQQDTLECTGSQTRDTTTVVNQEKYRGITRQMLELQKEVEGLTVTASRIEETLQQNEDVVEDTLERIESVQTSVSQVHMTADSIKASVSDLEEIVGSTTDALLQAKEQIAEVNLHASQLEVRIGTIVNDGTKKVSNTTGTFNEEGLQIDSTESTTKTQITPDGMKVYQKSYGSTVEMLTATSAGVDATNLHAKTYLIVGGRSRFENYGASRTGCFWIGE